VPLLDLIQSTLFFESEEPLDQGMFPGPALRGAMGWGLLADPSYPSQELANSRFHPKDPEQPCWRFCFSDPPTETGFSVDLMVWGKQAESDTALYARALSRSDLFLKLGHRQIHLRLDRIRPQPLQKLGWPGVEPVSAGTRSVHLQFLTPCCMRSGGRYLSSVELSFEHLGQSIQSRFGAACGIRRKDLLLPETPTPFMNTKLMECRLPVQREFQKTEPKGFMGEIHLEEVFGSWLQILALGEVLGVGGYVTQGMGNYRLLFA
jgi:hypothetical protein